MLRHIVVAASAALALMAAPAGAQAPSAPSPRIALVIGNGAYAGAPLQNALNDAGLVAEALRSIGFDIVDGADLAQADMARSLRDFVGKVEAAGPDAVAFVYFSGYGFAYAGDNFLAAADARLERDNDIPLDTLRLSDLLRALDGLPAQAKIVAVDAARPLPFGLAGAGLAPGLAALEAPPGMMIAYATEPGQTIEDGPGPYGPYATAIAEMVRTPGGDVVDDFIRVRARVAQLTDGRQLPWQAAALGQPVVLVPGDAAPAEAAAVPAPLRAARPMRDYGPDEGYAYAIERDDLPLYAEYVEDYPDSPYAPQIWAIIRTRREALAWLRAVQLDTPAAYWTYRQRYPSGIYVGDCERRLHRLAAPFAPPSGFVPVAFVGVPPPLPREPEAFVAFHRAPHPFAPPPAVLIPRQPAYFARLAPPPRQGGARVLPAPVPLPAVAAVTPGRRMSVVPSTPLSHSGPRPPGPPPSPGAAAAIVPGNAPSVAPSVAPNVLPRIDHRRDDRDNRETRVPPSAPAFVNHAPPPAVNVPPPPPPVVHQPPPAAIVNRVPPPPVVSHPPPPVVNRPPPPVVNRAPPPPPAAAVARPGMAPKKCVIENGMQVCR